MLSEFVDVLFIVDSNDAMYERKNEVNRWIKNLSSALKQRYESFQMRFGCIKYKTLQSKTECFDFDSDIDNLSDFLMTPAEDYVSPLTEAFDYQWNGVKIIYWIAAGPAYGKRFCGHFDYNHQDQEEKLVKMIEKLANDNYIFFAVQVGNGAHQTFTQFREIYQNSNKSPIFKMVEYSTVINKETILLPIVSYAVYIPNEFQQKKRPRIFRPS